MLSIANTDFRFFGKVAGLMRWGDWVTGKL
jgi:hypothetical protein